MPNGPVWEMISYSCAAVTLNLVVLARGACYTDMNDLQITDKYSSQVDIIVGTGRSLDDDGALNTICKLSNEMAVIPRRTVGSSNPCVGT